MFSQIDTLPREAHVDFNFTDRTRRVLVRARDEASAWGHDYLGTEHLLLGLLGETEGVSAAVLGRARLEPGALRTRVEAALGPGRRGGGELEARGCGGSAPELPYTSRAKKALEFAMAEAKELRHQYVGTEHLLLGLIREEKGIAAQALEAEGLTLERARSLTLAILTGSAASGVGPARDDRSHFHVRVDDASSSSIYEQIVAQVQEAIATGALRPGERLPSVRRLADELDIAPGTVARAYGELERIGVVVTDGARGTRVANGQQKPTPAPERRERLIGLLRPVAVAAFHMGATAADLRTALEPAMQGILSDG